MPALLGALGTIIVTALGRFLPKLLLALGLGVVAYKGADILVGHVQTYITNQLGALGGEVADTIGYFGIRTGLQMIMAAFTAKAASGVVSKIVFNKPSIT